MHKRREGLVMSKAIWLVPMVAIAAFWMPGCPSTACDPSTDPSCGGGGDGNCDPALDPSCMTNNGDNDNNNGDMDNPGDFDGGTPPTCNPEATRDPVSANNCTLTESANTLSTAVAQSSAVIAGGYAYVAGGITSNAPPTSTNVVQFAPVNEDGSLGAWSATTSLPASLGELSMVAHQRSSDSAWRLYVLGGLTEGGGEATTSSAVYIGSVSSDDGSVTWTTSPNSLPSSSAAGAAVYLNGYLYYFSGYQVSPTSTVSLTSVFYSQIQSDGTLGTWQTATAMPFARSKFGAVAADGYIYVVGGGYSQSAVSCQLSKIIQVMQNQDGSLGNWFWPATEFSYDAFGLGVAYANGMLVVGGGINHTDAVNAGSPFLYGAAINQSGVIGPWYQVGKDYGVSGAQGAQDRVMAASSSSVYSFGGLGIKNSMSVVMNTTSRLTVGDNGQTSCPAN